MAEEHEHRARCFRGAGMAAGMRVEAPTTPMDIAPTIMRHLGSPAGGMDGRPLGEG